MKHLLSIEALTAGEIRSLIAQGHEMKRMRGKEPQVLTGQCWAMMFAKNSTRTRVSFEVGVRELGGRVMFLSANDIQLGRGEPIKDTARVMGRMVHGAIIRTFAQRDVEEFAEFSKIPTINALTDAEHPCQILADLMTIEERLGSYDDRVVCFIGDGACNVPISWIWAAARLGFELRIAAPKVFQPDPEIVKRSGAKVFVTTDCAEAARGADVVYTDTWISMGKEAEVEYRMAQLAPYKIDAALMENAKPGAVVLHCLPAYRGKEISEEIMEAHATTIFDEAENRLHVQKAVIAGLVAEA